MRQSRKKRKGIRRAILAAHAFAAFSLNGCVQPMPPAAYIGSPPPLAANPPLQPQPYSVATPPPAASAWRLAGQPRSEALVGGHAWRWTVRVTDGDERIDLHLVQFDTRRFVIRVLDQPRAEAGGDAIDPVMRAHRAIAGVNGGFFTPEFQPLGLMIAGGRKVGGLSSAKLLGGMVLSTEGEPYLIWRSEFAGEAGVTDLVQAGPRLVDGGVAVGGLERHKSRARSFIATDGGRSWIIGVARSTSLGSLAEVLATPGLVPHMRVMRALNLDGGRSSAIWMLTAQRGPIFEPGWSTVRNYLAIMPR